MLSSKRILTILKQAAFLILALFVFTVFINLSWFDEKLHAQLQALQTPRPVSLGNNAYPLLWGLSAAREKDPFAVGKAVITQLQDLYQQGEKLEIPAPELAAIQGGEELDKDWQAQYQSLACNTRIALDCAAKLMVEVQQIGTSNERLQLILRRYEQLLRQDHFQENQEGDVYTPLPDYSLLLRTNRLYLTAKALTEEPMDYIQAAGKDFRFWLTMLREGEYLIAKMVALAGIRHNLQTTSHLIKSRYFSEQELVLLQTLYRAFTEEERNIGETFLAEMRINLLSWQSQDLLYGGPSWFMQLFWQENATLNDTYLRIYLPVQLLATLPAKDFYEHRGFAKQAFTIRAFPPDLYNLGGKLSLKDSIAGFNIQDYISRVHDADGQIAVLQLQIEIVLNPGANPRMIVEHSQFKNPYTQAPMEYKPEANTVGFDCLSPGQHDICQVLL